MYNFKRMLASKMARMTWLWIRGELLPCLQNSVPDDDLPCGLSTDCVDMGASDDSAPASVAARQLFESMQSSGKCGTRCKRARSSLQTGVFSGATTRGPYLPVIA
jgi:hypothetical protein